MVTNMIIFMNMYTTIAYPHTFNSKHRKQLVTCMSNGHMLRLPQTQDASLILACPQSQ